jgi:hypothetical protein
MVEIKEKFASNLDKIIIISKDLADFFKMIANKEKSGKDTFGPDVEECFEKLCEKEKWIWNEIISDLYENLEKKTDCKKLEFEQ